MIVEERTYTALPGKAKEWLAYYEEHAFPIQQKYLGRCLGFFTTELGTLNQIVHLWVYDSLAHRESARAKMAEDPGWHKFVSGSPSHLLVSQETRILNPTSFSPLK
jgi:hypothetical protein